MYRECVLASAADNVNSGILDYDVSTKLVCGAQMKPIMIRLWARSSFLNIYNHFVYTQIHISDYKFTNAIKCQSANNYLNIRLEWTQPVHYFVEIRTIVKTNITYFIVSLTICITNLIVFSYLPSVERSITSKMYILVSTLIVYFIRRQYLKINVDK